MHFPFRAARPEKKPRCFGRHPRRPRSYPKRNAKTRFQLGFNPSRAWQLWGGSPRPLETHSPSGLPRRRSDTPDKSRPRNAAFRLTGHAAAVLTEQHPALRRGGPSIDPELLLHLLLAGSLYAIYQRTALHFLGV